MDYKQLKQLAKKKRCPVTELIALAPQNDPYYLGTKSQTQLAEWFADLWERFGYTHGVHLRRIHYQIVSQDSPVSFPNGKPYENTLSCWSTLDNASKYARYLGLVDPWAFDDRRNGKPLIHMVEPEEPDITVDDGFWEGDLELPSFPDIPSYEIKNYDANHRYHIEIWVEKSTMNDILIPFCEFHDANLITAVGEFSITHVVWLMDRLRRYEKPCRIFYISDFDPAGLSMPVAVSRKIEKFISDEDGGVDVKLYPLILTHEQCLKYELPRTPIKETERRADRFERRFGAGATELDALEAIHPGKLEKILSDAIWSYRDDRLNLKVAEARTELREDLDSVRNTVLNEYWGDIKELQAEYEDLTNEFQEKAGSLIGRIENVWQAIKEEMEQECVDIDEYPIPEAKEADEFPGALFNANRDYLEQIVAYKEFQGKPTRAKRKESSIIRPDMNVIIRQIEQGFKSHENHNLNR